MSLLLHKASGTNRWCGTHCISFLTGMSTDQASRLVRSWNRRKHVTGMHTRELLTTLKMCNIHADEVWNETHKPVQRRSTIKQWIDMSKHDRSARSIDGVMTYNTYLVRTTRHFQIVQGDFYLDNHNPDPILFSDLKNGKRQRMEGVHRLFIPDGMQVKIPDEANKAQHDWHWYRRKAKALAWNLDITLEPDHEYDEGDSGTVWTYVSDKHEHVYGDPWDIEHYCHGWKDVFIRLTEERARRVRLDLIAHKNN